MKKAELIDAMLERDEQERAVEAAKEHGNPIPVFADWNVADELAEAGMLPEKAPRTAEAPAPEAPAAAETPAPEASAAAENAPENAPGTAAEPSAEQMSADGERKNRNRERSGRERSAKKKVKPGTENAAAGAAAEKKAESGEAENAPAEVSKAENAPAESGKAKTGSKEQGGRRAQQAKKTEKNAGKKPAESGKGERQKKGGQAKHTRDGVKPVEAVKPAAEAVKADAEEAKAPAEPKKAAPESGKAAPEPKKAAPEDGKAVPEPKKSAPEGGRTAPEAKKEAEPRIDLMKPEKAEEPAPEETGEAQFPGTIPSKAARGILEIMPDGYGFLRSAANYLSGDEDVYVSPSQIRRFNLRTGDLITGFRRDRGQGEKYGGLLYVGTVNGKRADDARKRFTFEKMTPIFPDERIRLEHPGGSRAIRIVDLISPIGKGQRGMIVSPPKAGKTTLLKDIARSILAVDPKAHLIILLIDERPEEVTDMIESVTGENVEVVYSTFDELPDHHRRVSEMVIERAKRMVELKEDVVILLDSITRLARAYNVLVPPSGRTLSGGIDPTALYMPKRFFGAARNMREGGSLTILATALVDTGSKMDDVIYEEFKGTGNMELILDRKLQERRIFPAIDIVRSGTRREDLLLDEEEQRAVYLIRRKVNGVKAEEAVEMLLNAFAKYETNQEVVEAVKERWKN